MIPWSNVLRAIKFLKNSSPEEIAKSKFNAWLGGEFQEPANEYVYVAYRVQHNIFGIRINTGYGILLRYVGNESTYSDVMEDFERYNSVSRFKKLEHYDSWAKRNSTPESPTLE